MVTKEQVHQACVAAEAAFVSFSQTSRQQRAELLNAIADEIEARGDAITEIGTSETGLPAARLQGERGRTTGQLRLFAQHILNGDYLDRRHDEALPDRQPIPRPDLKMVQRPVGPVAVLVPRTSRWLFPRQEVIPLLLLLQVVLWLSKDTKHIRHL